MEPQHRFGDLYSLLTHHDWLAQAYDHVKTHTGAQTPGVDGVTRRLFEVDLEDTLETLRQELKAGTFVPLPVRRTTIEERQADGRLKERRFSIAALRDRIVQEGLRMLCGVLPTSPRESRCSFAYSHPYEKHPMTWRQSCRSRPLYTRNTNWTS